MTKRGKIKHQNKRQKPSHNGAVTLDHVGENASSLADGMYRHARLIVGSDELAEDVVQDVFTNTIREIKKGRKIEHDKLRAWLHTCVQNSALYALRRIKRRPVEQLKNDDLLSGCEGIEDKIETRTDSKAILASLSEMPPRQRDAFISIDLKGLDYSQTAVEMGTTSDSVRQLIFRARRLMRAQLSNGRMGALAPLSFPAYISSQLRRPLSRAHAVFSQIVPRISPVPGWYLNRIFETMAVVAVPIAAALFIVPPSMGTGTVTGSEDPGANLGVVSGYTSSNGGIWTGAEGARPGQLTTEPEDGPVATVMSQTALGPREYAGGKTDLLNTAGSNLNQMCLLAFCSLCGEADCLPAQHKDNQGETSSLYDREKQYSVVTSQKRSVVIDSDVSVVVYPRQSQVVYQSRERTLERGKIREATRAPSRSNGHRDAGIEDGAVRIRGRDNQPGGTLSPSDRLRTHLEAPVREQADRNKAQPGHSSAAKTPAPVAGSIDRGLNTVPAIPHQSQEATGERQVNKVRHPSV